MNKQVTEYLGTRHKPENTNIKHRQALDNNDKIALFITNAIGTMYAVYFFILVIVAWITWETFFSAKPLDPYPFSFLLFIGNIVQLLLMPLIMVGQNIQGKHAAIRAEEEFKTTNSSYKDIEQILLQLTRQEEELIQQRALIEELTKSVKK